MWIPRFITRSTAFGICPLSSCIVFMCVNEADCFGFFFWFEHLHKSSFNSCYRCHHHKAHIWVDLLNIGYWCPCLPFLGGHSLSVVAKEMRLIWGRHWETIKTRLCGKFLFIEFRGSDSPTSASIILFATKFSSYPTFHPIKTNNFPRN